MGKKVKFLKKCYLSYGEGDTADKIFGQVQLFRRVKFPSSTEDY